MPPVLLSPQSTPDHKAHPGQMATEGLGEPPDTEPGAAASNCPDHPSLWDGRSLSLSSFYPFFPAASPMKSCLLLGDVPSFSFIPQAEHFGSRPQISSSSKLGWDQPWDKQSPSPLLGERCAVKSEPVWMWVVVGGGGKSQLCTDELGTRDPVLPRREDPENKQSSLFERRPVAPGCVNPISSCEQHRAGAAVWSLLLLSRDQSQKTELPALDFARPPLCLLPPSCCTRRH